jgi:ATP-dependent DNA ligase
VARLASEHPAVLVVFDLVVDGRGTPLIDRPLRDRRPRLESFARREFRPEARIRLSPATGSSAQARRWLRSGGGGLDGVIAKRLDLPYRSGDRTGMQKIKQLHTADCCARTEDVRHTTRTPFSGR